MMKEIFDKEKYIDTIGRVFVLAVQYKIHLQVITDTLAKSDLVKGIETGNYSELINNSPSLIFTHYFDIPIIEDNSLFNYNDAYWCGYIYMNIFYRYNKPLSYIFLKLPLSSLLEMYDVYHEMDITNVYEVFEELMTSESILSLLLKKHSLKLIDVSEATNISINILKKYKNNDNYLYRGSFNNIHRIALFMNEPDNLFIEHL